MGRNHMMLMIKSGWKPYDIGKKRAGFGAQFSYHASRIVEFP